MPAFLRHRDTGEVFPMNPDMARHDSMEVVHAPDVAAAAEGFKPLEEVGVLAEETPESEVSEEETAPPKPKAKAKARAKPKPEDSDDVDLSDIDLPED